MNQWTCCILRSPIYASTGRLDDALPVLLQTIVDEAAPLGHIRLFAEEGEPLADLIRQLPVSPYTQKDHRIIFPIAIIDFKESNPPLLWVYKSKLVFVQQFLLLDHF